MGKGKRQATSLTTSVGDSLVRILGKRSEHTHIVIQEIAEVDWGFSGLLTDDWKKSRHAHLRGKPIEESDFTAFSPRTVGLSKFVRCRPIMRISQVVYEPLVCSGRRPSRRDISLCHTAVDQTGFMHVQCLYIT